MWIIQDAAMQTEWSHRKPAGKVKVTHGCAASVSAIEQFVLHSWQLKAWQEGTVFAGFRVYYRTKFIPVKCVYIIN